MKLVFGKHRGKTIQQLLNKGEYSYIIWLKENVDSITIDKDIYEFCKKNVYNYELPVDYTKLSSKQRKEVRLQYIETQKNKCFFCGCSLLEKPPKRITDKKIKWKLFPKNFLNYPIHLQHNHSTGMTEGAVHAYCNAVMWQYFGR